MKFFKVTNPKTLTGFFVTVNPPKNGWVRSKFESVPPLPESTGDDTFKHKLEQALRAIGVSSRKMKISSIQTYDPLTMIVGPLDSRPWMKLIDP